MRIGVVRVTVAIASLAFNVYSFVQVRLGFAGGWGVDLSRLIGTALAFAVFGMLIERELARRVRA